MDYLPRYLKRIFFNQPRRKIPKEVTASSSYTVFTLLLLYFGPFNIIPLRMNFNISNVSLRNNKNLYFKTHYFDSNPLSTYLFIIYVDEILTNELFERLRTLNNTGPTMSFGPKDIHGFLSSCSSISAMSIVTAIVPFSCVNGSWTGCVSGILNRYAFFSISGALSLTSSTVITMLVVDESTGIPSSMTVTCWTEDRWLNTVVSGHG